MARIHTAFGKTDPPAGPMRSQAMDTSDRTDGTEAGERDIDLTNDQRDAVEEREVASALVTHEVVRRHGDEELTRPTGSLIWSGLAGGVAVSASILGQALLGNVLPDTRWADAIGASGYSLGFLIVILGRMQLFTESTLTAVIPVATHPDIRNLGRLLRLWGIVLVANLAGTLLVATMVHAGVAGDPPLRSAMIDLARVLLTHDPLRTVALAIPAGFLMATIPWILPSARGQEFWVIVFITWFIALGKFAHVVAGSGEAWLLLLSGEMTVGSVAIGFLLPALVGNIIGGTMLFALLAHAQVRQEL